MAEEGTDSVKEVEHQLDIKSDKEAIPPFAKVRGSVEYWEKMEKSDFAVKIIKRGLTIPFDDKAKVYKACKVDIEERKTSKVKKNDLLYEIKKLLQMNIIERVPRGTKVFENHVFCVKKPTGKLRVIFDMKILNQYIKLPKLKMFKFSFSYQELLRNSFACKIDLSDAYWHIEVNFNFRRFLAFKFGNVIYQWKAMPFGLKTAPFLFCKVMGTFVQHIRLKFNIIIYFYMDDLFIVGPSKEVTEDNTKLVIQELLKAGLTVNVEKSILVPLQVIDFLGVRIDLILKTLFPSESNSKCCLDKVKKFKKAKVESLKGLQSLIGSINFISSYIQFGKIKMSPLFAFIPYFDDVKLKRVPMQLKESLSWWSKKNFVPLGIPDFNRPVVKLFSDASTWGWGAQLVWPDDSKESFNGVWSDEEVNKHINVKELKAVWYTLKVNAMKLSSYWIKIFSDNRSTVIWLKKESSTRSTEARKIILEILKLKYKYNLLWTSVYIKGSNNVIADNLSRSLKVNAELTIKPTSYRELCKVAKCSPEVDLFANSENSKCKIFFSASAVPNSAGVNALNQDWDSFGCAFAFPPCHLVNKVIHKYIKSRCKKLLLIFHRDSQATEIVKKLNAKIIPFRFSKKDLQIQENTKILASDPSDLIVALL